MPMLRNQVVFWQIRPAIFKRALLTPSTIMSTVPTTLEETIEQAKIATLAALAAGETRLQVELVLPEIALQAQSLARQFADSLADYGLGLKVIFVDTGAAALARRDWGDTAFKVSDLGSRLTNLETKISPDDQIFLIVCPSAIEVNIIEKLFSLVQERPVILLIPQLEDVSIVGIGYAARQLREGFLSTLYSCYYIRPLEGAVVLRSHGSPWQVYLEKDETYQLISETPEKPLGETLENILASTTNSFSETPTKPKKTGILNNLQKFLRALSQ